MPRIKFKKSYQVKFLNDIREKLGFNNWLKLAETLKVLPRCLSDWKRAKYTLPEKVFKKCIKLTEEKIETPSYRILPDFWSVRKAGRKGGLKMFEKYGVLGTLKSRRRGGLVSQQKRRLFPELYKNCNLRKNISKPKNSTALAEFVGIILGDGSIKNNQAVITLHKKDSRHYILFVCNMIKRLFSINPAVYYAQSNKHKNVADITVSSISFIDFLISKGLKKGHKVKQQVGVPRWIKINKNFSRYCIRGLIDTDGCVYLHNHKSNGHDCFNIGLNFSNKSTPLLKFMYGTLTNLNFHPKIFRNGGKSL